MNAIAFNNNMKYLACVDLHNDHNLFVFDVESGQQVWKEKGGTAKIFDICFSEMKNTNLITTVGSKHIMFWNLDDKSSKKGIFQGKGEATSFACATYDHQNLCYTGGSNSLIYVWEGRSLQKTIKKKEKGFICTIKFNGKFLISGGKDGNIVVYDVVNGGGKVYKTIDMGCMVRAVDQLSKRALIGLRNGCIYSVEIETDSRKLLMESHSDGEVWGLTCFDTYVATTADDN